MLRCISLVLVVATCSAGTGCLALGQPQPAFRSAAVVDDPAALERAGISSVNSREENAARFAQYEKQYEEGRQQTETKRAEPPGLGSKLVEDLVTTPLLYVVGTLWFVTGNGLPL